MAGLHRPPSSHSAAGCGGRPSHQWPPARRAPERDHVHVARPGEGRPRGMAARLQRRAASFEHRLADAGRLCRPVYRATGPRRCTHHGLCAVAPYHRADRGVQPPDSGYDWIKVGGNVTCREPLEQARPDSRTAWSSRRSSESDFGAKSNNTCVASRRRENASFAATFGAFDASSVATSKIRAAASVED